VGAREYGVHRYGMEVQRLCSVLNNHLAKNQYMVNEEYSIADMACFPWFQMLRKGGYRCGELKCSDFLEVSDNYPHAVRWADTIESRPAVQRGMTVCGWKSEHVKPWLHNGNLEGGK
jgi:GSH-dependent disulfide-bond oxidoreductase